MSDLYQATYDAVRSRIGGCDVEGVIRRVVENAFSNHGIDYHASMFVSAATAPEVLMRPKLFVDGDKWCALYGDNIVEGVAGFGASPADAMADFNRNWFKKIENTGGTP